MIQTAQTQATTGLLTPIRLSLLSGPLSPIPILPAAPRTSLAQAYFFTNLLHFNIDPIPETHGASRS